MRYSIGVKLRRAIVVGLVVGVFGSVLVSTPFGLDLEERIGLTWLFKLRGPVSPPPDALVVSIDKASAQDLGVSNVAPWPRYWHACLIDILTELGASAIVFDVFFRHRTLAGELPSQRFRSFHRCARVQRELSAGADENAVLAAAMRRSARVLLLHHADHDSRKTSKGVIIQVQPELPTPTLIEAAAAIGPFPLPIRKASVTRFRTHQKIAGRYLATLPYLALNLHGEGAPSVDPIGFAMLATEKNLAPSDSERLLNFYGPPGAICTIAYSRILGSRTLSSSSGCNADLDLGGKVVFVGAGWSEVASANQRDSFDTVFSGGPGNKHGGVEIAATAFANLLTDTGITRLGGLASAALMLMTGFAVGLLATLLSGLRAVAAVLALGLVYVVGAHFFFVTEQLWAPVFSLLVVQLPLALLIGLLSQYWLARRDRERYWHAIRRYVPHKVAESVARKRDIEMETETVYGTCLCTDIADYTTLSEKIAPAELAGLANEYFGMLGERVAARKGELLEIAGDSMICVWPSAQPDATVRMRACRAALDMTQAVDEFNLRHPDRPFLTRVGLYSCWAVMGHVGGGGHFNYRAIGDITNTASRIEGLNKVLGTNLLAAESVVSGLPQVFVRPMGAFLLKGKMNALSLFEIMANDKDATDEQRRLCAQFSRALEVFKQRDWREASRLLAAILKDFPNDRPSRYYLGMCQRYALVPPEHNEAQAIRIETK